MRKAALPDENRRRAERLFDGESEKEGSKILSAGEINEDLEEETEELIKKSAKRSARDYALLLVSTHTYTERALWQKIKAKKLYSDGDISDAIDFVKGFGYINDRRLAENSIEKLAARCWGRSKICRYLAAKGISEDIIDSLDFSEIDFVYHCGRLSERYKGKPYEKIMRALLNAGYTYEEINEATAGEDY